jgi:hypothetical protein
MLKVWGRRAMFLRCYKRTKDGKQHTYYALVESERTPDGPRQRTVAYLGELNHDQERRWQRTIVFHNRQGDAQQLRLFPDDDSVALPDDPDIVRIRLQRVGWTHARRFGDVWLAWQMWRLLNLDDIVGRHLPSRKHTCRPADIVAIEVINRLCGPCSEFALAEHWYASTALEDLLGVADAEVTKDRLYRTLDGLLAAHTQIEDDLQKQLQTLFVVDGPESSPNQIRRPFTQHQLLQRVVAMLPGLYAMDGSPGVESESVDAEIQQRASGS